jgi:hypothetical protein
VSFIYTAAGRMYYDTAFAASGMKVVLVLARDDDGLISAIDTIRVSIRDKAPLLFAPINNAQLTGKAATLEWRSGFYNHHYRVLFDTVNPPVTVAKDSTRDSTLEVSSRLAFSCSYWWRVIGYSALDSADTSDAWKFTTGAMPRVALLAPQDLAQMANLNVALSWQPGYYRHHYIVLLDTIQPPERVANGNVTDTQLNVSGLIAYSDTFYWRVIALDSAGHTDTSAVRMLSTPEPVVFNILCVASDLVSGNAKILAISEATTAETLLTTDDTSCSEAQWSPNGQMICYSRRNPYNYTDIWVMDGDGSNKLRITPVASQSVGSPSNPAWHNNGTEILYSKFASTLDRTVYIINTNGSNDRALFSSLNAINCMPNMNPADSDMVGYYYDEYNWAPSAEIHIRTPSTGADTVLKGDRGKGINGGPMRFSPDGNYFIYSEYSETMPGHTDLMRITVSDKTISTLYAAASNEHARGAFSRTNGDVYFSVINSTTNVSKIYRCRADGTNRLELLSKSNCNLTLTSVK